MNEPQFLQNSRLPTSIFFNESRYEIPEYYVSKDYAPPFFFGGMKMKLPLYYSFYQYMPQSPDERIRNSYFRFSHKVVPSHFIFCDFPEE
jgi:hypothetical protein